MSQDIYKIKVEWSPEDNAFLATSGSFPGLITHGDTPLESIDEFKIAVKLTKKNLK